MRYINILYVCMYVCMYVCIVEEKHCLYNFTISVYSNHIIQRYCVFHINTAQLLIAVDYNIGHCLLQQSNTTMFKLSN